MNGRVPPDAPLVAPPARPSVLFLDHAGVLGGAELSLLDLATAFSPRAEVLLLADGPFRSALAARGVCEDADGQRVNGIEADALENAKVIEAAENKARMRVQRAVREPFDHERNGENGASIDDVRAEAGQLRDAEFALEGDGGGVGGGRRGI